MNDRSLPENDKDLQLARRIGKLLDAEQLSPEALLQSEFEQVLGQFKKAESQTAQSQVSPEVSNKMWNAISTATQSASIPKGTQAKIFTLWPRIAVAASILVAIVIGWLVLQPTPGPTLVAQANDTILVHTLGDGSTITLRPNSALYETSTKQNDVQFNLEGEAFFDVTSNPERTFKVQAGVAQVAVLGTRFNVINRDDLTSVYLEEGRVELTHMSTKDQVILSPGQVGTIARVTSIELTEAEDNTEFLDWLDDQIVFKEKKLIEIVAELEFHFSVNVELPENMRQDTYTGELSLESLDAALEKLSFIMGGGRFVQTGPTRHKFEPTQ